MSLVSTIGEEEDNQEHCVMELNGKGIFLQ